MRRSAVLEGIDDEAELVLSVFLADAENLEHPLLHCCFMDSDGSATEFRAVQDEVVGIGADPFEVLLPV